MYRSVNKNFFKKWTPEMAYVLGYFMADGYVTQNKRGANYFCFQICDLDILEKIKKELGSDHKISLKQKYKDEHSIQYRLQIGSKEICEDLSKLGVIAGKTNNMKVPVVPRKYLHHFVRGYFDGDGNIWMGRIHKHRKNPTITIATMFTSCSRHFLRKLHEKLRAAGIHGGSIYKSRENYSRLQFSSGPSLKLYDFMYNQCVNKSGLFLERKKSVFEKYIQQKIAAVV